MAKHVLIALAALLALATIIVTMSGRAEFVLGGALINAGFRLQDHLEPYDPEGALKLTPEQIFHRLLAQNANAAGVRKLFPRTPRHPLVAMVVCMDARIDTAELVGDTRRYYYVVRTAGSVLGPQEQDMLQLAVENGVKVVLLTTHSECAAEKVAKDPKKRADYPALSQAVDERAARDVELLRRPAFATRIQRGELVVRHAHIDTHTARMELRTPPK